MAFARLLSIQEPLMNAARWQCPEILWGQVGAGTATEADILTADANHHCDILVNATLWNDLGQITRDIKVLCCAISLFTEGFDLC
jgi:hypothetical protein